MISYPEILFHTDAVQFGTVMPFIFTSGLRSPIYLDNRRVPGFPREFRYAIDLLRDMVTREVPIHTIDIISGTSTAGIPWATRLASELYLPVNWVKAEAKSHGMASRIQGIPVLGKNVLVVEDHFSTAGSTAKVIEAIREEGGIVSFVVSLTTYQTQKAEDTFRELSVEAYSLTTGKIIVRDAVNSGVITREAETDILNWFATPQEWSKQRMTAK